MKRRRWRGVCAGVVLILGTAVPAWASQGFAPDVKTGLYLSYYYDWHHGADGGSVVCGNDGANYLWWKYVAEWSTAGFPPASTVASVRLVGMQGRVGEASAVNLHHIAVNGTPSWDTDWASDPLHNLGTVIPQASGDGYFSVDVTTAVLSDLAQGRAYTGFRFFNPNQGKTATMCRSFSNLVLEFTLASPVSLAPNLTTSLFRSYYFPNVPNPPYAGSVASTVVGWDSGNTWWMRHIAEWDTSKFPAPGTYSTVTLTGLQSTVLGPIQVNLAAIPVDGSAPSWSTDWNSTPVQDFGPIIPEGAPGSLTPFAVDVTEAIADAVANGRAFSGFRFYSPNEIYVPNPIGSGSCRSLSNLTLQFDYLDRGHALLLQRGLQIQALTFSGPDMSRFNETNFTGLNYWCYDMSSGYYPAPGPQWGRWHSRNYSNDIGLKDWEMPYLSQMVSLQYDDENDISDPAVVATMKDWFARNRQRYPDVINHDDQKDQFSLEVNKAYVVEAKPDMVMFNSYPFNGNLTGGSPTNWYRLLQLFRQVGLAGLDGNGGQPIPYALYLQGIERGGHTPSESEMRLNQFAAWAFGYTFAEMFVYTTPWHDPSLQSIFFTGLGDTSPTAKLAEISQINRESRNLGPALIRLLSTDVRFLPGQHVYKILGFPIETRTNSVPDGLTSGLAGADPYLTGASASNPGSRNDGKRGDVIIGFFKVLHESFDGDACSNERYFMVTNGLSDASGTASQTLQNIRLTFDFGSSGITRLQRLSRQTGQVEVVPLVHESGSIYHLDLALGGGTGDLFKYDTGAPFVGVSTSTVQLLGDADRNGQVTFEDFAILQNHYGQSVTGDTWSQGDFNGDGQVTFEDFCILQNHYGQSIASGQASAAAEADGDVLASGLACPAAGLIVLMGMAFGLFLVRVRE